MPDRLKELYQEIILVHNKNPHNYSRRQKAQVVLEAYNPVCGDQYELYFDVVDNHVRELSFYGYGCAISKASASIMTSIMNGQSLDKILGLDQALRSVIGSGKYYDPIPTELMAFETVKKHPGRIKCVTLTWDTLKDHLTSR